MKNVTKFLKKNKNTVIVVVLCLILTIIVFALKITFFPDEAKAIYGDRLDNLKQNEISKSDLTKIEDELSKKDEVEKVSTSIAGRILNVLITVNDETSKDTARTYPSSVDSQLDDDQKKAYDVQIFVMKTNDDASFPIIAYRHQGNDSYSFTKDR